MVPQRWPRYRRDLDGAWHAIEDIRERIDGMQLAEEVAEKVRETIRNERNLRLTWLQKASAFGVGAVALADFIRSLVS